MTESIKRLYNRNSSPCDDDIFEYRHYDCLYFLTRVHVSVCTYITVGGMYMYQHEKLACGMHACMYTCT